MSRRAFLPEQQAELRRLEFDILTVEPDGLMTAKGNKLYWDCFYNVLNYTVFIRRVDVLSAQIIEADRNYFHTLNQTLSPSTDRKRIDQQDVIATVYIANTVNSDAQQLWQKDTKFMLFHHFYATGALELSTGKKFLTETSQMRGAVYYPKINYLIHRLLDPKTAPKREPVSIVLVILSLLYLPFAILYSLFRLLYWPLAILTGLLEILNIFS